MTDDFERRLERAQADGRMTTGDADEIRNFASFLEAIADIPYEPADRTVEQNIAWLDAYKGHYPEDFERQIADARSRVAAAKERSDDSH